MQVCRSNNVLRLFRAFTLTLILTGCGGSGDSGPGPTIQFVTQSGQVELKTSTPSNVSAYAAARLLDHASWGPTPQSIQEVQRLGVLGWVNQQVNTPSSQISTPSFVTDFEPFSNPAAAELARGWVQLQAHDLAMAGPDQLRQRVAWALYNFIPVGSGQPYGEAIFYNLLHSHAFGSYRALLKSVTLDPGMGFFLNNNQNTEKEPNENYARELMQLFSVGLVMLNMDGTPIRDAQGTPVQTYSQADVTAATRALSGWTNHWEEDLPLSNFANFGKPMRAEEWRHDKGEKKLLGITLRAGQSPEKDLDQVLDILMAHPNTAPFVSIRLIQNLVTSDPSPAYIQRVATAFKTSNGNLGETVKAILLDPEARQADDPRVRSTVGRMKEPLLHTLGLLRAMGCRTMVRNFENPNQPIWISQNRFHPPSVFGFVSPFHRAPQSLTLAPEQRLLNASEIDRRAGHFNWLARNGEKQFNEAGCELGLFSAAANQSDEHLLKLLSERMFKGAMPAALQNGARQLLAAPETASKSSVERVFSVIGVLSATPSYGVIQ